MKVKVKYILDTEYEFNDNGQLSYFPDDYENPESRARNWIEEDFRRLETRADNILPPYHSILFFDFKEE